MNEPVALSAFKSMTVLAVQNGWRVVVGDMFHMSRNGCSLPEAEYVFQTPEALADWMRRALQDYARFTTKDGA